MSFLIFFLSCNLFNPEFPKKVKDIDGNVYQTVKIGDQLWMAENLKVTRYRNGEEIPNLIADSAWVHDILGAYCAYDYDEACADTCGYLYNWYAVNNPNGLAPEGWHVSTDEEWKQLEIYIGMSQKHADSIGYRGTYEAQKLKASYGWDYIIDGLYYDENGTDEYGFTALPCGDRHIWTITRTTEFNKLNYGTEFWTSTELSDRYAWNRRFDWSSTQIARWNNIGKIRGCSVRCVKDSIDTN